MDDKGNFTDRPRRLPRNGATSSKSSRRRSITWTFAQAARLRCRVADSVPRTRRRQPRVDGFQHATPGRAAPRHRGAARRHRHGRRVARDSRAVLVAEEAGMVASVNGNQIVITKDGQLPEGKKKIKHDPEKGIYVYDAQVHALQRRHLRQPEAGPQGPEDQERRCARRRPRTAERRTRPRPQRARRVHALERLQLRGRHPHQRDAS